MMGSPIRFTGLFSGMDTQSMVQQLMRAESMRMDRLTRRRQTLMWRQEDLRSTMGILNNFRAENTSLNNAVGGITDWRVWNTAQATVSARGGGSTAGFTVTTNSQTPLGVTSIQVDQLAQSDLARGSGLATGQGLHSTTMDDFLGANWWNDTNNQRPTMVYQRHSGDDITVSISDGDGGMVDVTVREGDRIPDTANPGQFLMEQARDGENNPIYHHVLDFNGVEIEVREGDTIQAFMNRVNANHEVGITLRFDAVREVFTVEGRTTGAEGGRVETNDNAFFAAIGLANLGYVQDFGANGMQQNTLAAVNTSGETRWARLAQDAVVTIDGDVTRQYASNAFHVAGTGLHISLTQAVNVGETFVIDTTRNVDSAYNAIRRFVENYNDLLRTLNALHSTPRPRQTNGNFFDPLTDDQRQGMSDREIERWELEARRGLLHRDDSLRELHNQMRDWIYRGVQLDDGTTISLSQIGITTGYGSGSERLIGMLQIDSEQLRTALAERGEDVENLFSQTAPPAEGEDPMSHAAQMNSMGIGHRISRIIDGAVGNNGSILTRAGDVGRWNVESNPMSTQIRDYNNRIEQMQRFLLRRENHFFAMFARMEQAMAQANAQMDSLWMFGSM